MKPAVRSSASLPAVQRDLLRILGYSCQRHGRGAQAIAIFAALHAIDPDDDFATRSLAHAHASMGEAAPALELLNGLLDRGDSSALTHLLRGQALAQLGRFAEAARAMRLYVGARAENVLGEQ